jgi:hypothetical protein
VRESVIVLLTSPVSIQETADAVCFCICFYFVKTKSNARQ